MTGSMTRVWPLICCIGFLSVLLGAAGDHLLQGQLTDVTSERWDVALRYHQLYSIVLLSLYLFGLSLPKPTRLYNASIIIFLCGMCFFSGSLYLSILLNMENLTRLTPLGGVLLMAGWLFLTISLPRSRTES